VAEPYVAPDRRGRVLLPGQGPTHFARRSSGSEVLTLKTNREPKAIASQQNKPAPGQIACTDNHRVPREPGVRKSSPPLQAPGGLVCILLATIGTGLAISFRQWGQAALFAFTIPFCVTGTIWGFVRLKKEKSE
jgi:hypothetical protein